MEETGHHDITESSAKDSHNKPTFKRICVFCGSRSGFKPAFSDAALMLANLLVERKIDLVYGGGSLGLMGLISKTVFNGGCHVIGVIPRAVFPREISGATFGEEKIVADMHERKSEMVKRADAFIALPGGYGTMEELLEVIAWSEIGIHSKPVGLLNVEGYFNSLLRFFDKGVYEGFIESSARNLMVVADTPAELMHKMETNSKLGNEVEQLLKAEATGEKSGEPQRNVQLFYYILLLTKLSLEL